MAHGVMHRALRAVVVAIGQLTGAFVASWPPTAPTRRYSYGGGCSDWWSVAASLLLVFVTVVAVAAALGLCPSIGLALTICHLGDWGVLGAALHHLGALVRQAEEQLP
jgi:hypothetical protein